MFEVTHRSCSKPAFAFCKSYLGIGDVARPSTLSASEAVVRGVLALKEDAPELHSSFAAWLCRGPERGITGTSYVPTHLCAPPCAPSSAQHSEAADDGVASCVPRHHVSVSLLISGLAVVRRTLFLQYSLTPIAPQRRPKTTQVWRLLHGVYLIRLRDQALLVL